MWRFGQERWAADPSGARARPLCWGVSMSSRLVLALLIVPLMLAGSCSPPTTKKSTTPRPAFDISVLRNALDAKNLTVTSSETATQGVFSGVAGYQPLSVAGRPLEVYWFPMLRDAVNAASAVRKDGRALTVQGAQVPVRWRGDPHFFRRDRVLALYLSTPATITPTDREILGVLTQQMGPQFAGAATK